MSTINKSSYSIWSRGLTEQSREEGHGENSAATRLTNDGPVDIFHQPRFFIAPDAGFFCIGSCFARNIERALVADGYDVLSNRFALPHGVTTPHQGATGVLTKFNTYSMVSEVEQAVSEQKTTTHPFVEVKPGQFWDPQLHNIGTMPLDRAVATREAVNTCFSLIRKADVCIITLGLTEMWWDTELSIPLNNGPIDWRWAMKTKRFEFRNPPFEELRDNVLDLCTRLKNAATNPDMKIVLTVSPVPLHRTFTNKDIIVANNYSKSILRSIAETVVNTLDYTDYYPSYEMVVYSPRNIAWHHDQRHVQDDLVKNIVKKFIELYVVKT